MDNMSAANKFDFRDSKLSLLGFGLVLVAGLSFRISDVLPGRWLADHLIVVFILGTLMAPGLVIGLVFCLISLFRDRGRLTGVAGLILAGVLFGRSIGLYGLMGAYGLIPLAPFLVLIGVGLFCIVKWRKKRQGPVTPGE